MKKEWIMSMILPCLVILSLASCDKKDDPMTDNNMTPAVDNAIAEAYFEDVFTQVNAESGNEGMNRGTNPASATLASAGCADSIKIITNGGDYPKTLVIYFNNTPCSDGHVRSGTITATLSGKFYQPGTSIAITLQNYTVDGTLISGTKTITYNGYNDKGNLTFSIRVNNGRVSNSSGTILWETERLHEWSAGMNTLFYAADDEYTITGTASGTDRQGTAFTAAIQSPLLVKANCAYITKGTISLATASRSLLIDYGNGTCDNKAVVTIGNTSFTIELK